MTRKFVVSESYQDFRRYMNDFHGIKPTRNRCIVGGVEFICILTPENTIGLRCNEYIITNNGHRNDYFDEIIQHVTLFCIMKENIIKTFKFGR